MNKYYFTTEISYLLNPPLPSKFNHLHKQNLENVYFSQKKTPLGHCPPPDIPVEYQQSRFGVATSKDISASELIHPSENRVHLSAYAREFSPPNKPIDSAPAGLKSEKSDNTGNQMKEIIEQNSSENSIIILPSSYAKRLNHGLAKSVLIPKAEESEKISTLERYRNALKDKNSVEILWNLLKRKNYIYFKDLKSAFEAYWGGSEKITSSDLQRMCQKFGISAPLYIIEKLIKECDVIDNDGSLSYEEFMHSLNWKDLLPEDSRYKTSPYSTDWQEGINNPPLDIIDHYKTTYASLGSHGHLMNQRPPRKSTYDHGTNKLEFNGDREDLALVLQPSSFSKYGVAKDDLTELHPREEIYDLLIQSGIEFSKDAFEKAWSKVNKNGYASIGIIWNELKSLCLLQSKTI